MAALVITKLKTQRLTKMMSVDNEIIEMKTVMMIPAAALIKMTADDKRKGNVDNNHSK